MPGLPQSFWEYVSRSTLKREAASLCMLWLLSMATYLMVTAPTFEQKLQVISLFTLPIIGFFTLAFGADYLAKQTNIGGPPQGSEDGGLKVEVKPQDVDMQGTVSGTIKVDEEQKANG